MKPINPAGQSGPASFRFDQEIDPLKGTELHQTPLVSMRGIVKSYSGVTVLKGVDFSINSGEAHALVGENGAGKSTLMKVLTGVIAPDKGTLEVDGTPTSFAGPLAAQVAGIVAVHQEIPVLASRSVAENIFLGREPTRFGIVAKQKMIREAQLILDRLRLPIDPRTPLEALSLAMRQLVTIARALSLRARVLVLDEPTSSLTHEEVDTLFSLLRGLLAEGTGIIYISHRFDELYTLCHRVTILRDGRHVATRPMDGIPRRALAGLMLGKSDFDESPSHSRESADHRAGAKATWGKPSADGRPDERSPTGLQLKSVGGTPLPQGVTCSVKPGEVVGMAGLLGSGRTETLRLLFGLDRVSFGSVTVDGKRRALRNPRQAIAAGLAFLAEDRKAEGLFPDLSIRENMTLAALPSFSRWGVVQVAKERLAVASLMKRLKIHAAHMDQPIKELSGGNQQKVLLARWLLRNPRYLLLDEPTRGIDVGAKDEVRSLIRQLAQEGRGVLVVSSELDELAQISHRVVVLHDGKSTAELAGGDLNPNVLVQAMAGHGRTSSMSQPTEGEAK